MGFSLMNPSTIKLPLHFWIAEILYCLGSSISWASSIDYFTAGCLNNLFVDVMVSSISRTLVSYLLCNVLYMIIPEHLVVSWLVVCHLWFTQPDKCWSNSIILQYLDQSVIATDALSFLVSAAIHCLWQSINIYRTNHIWNLLAL